MDRASEEHAAGVEVPSSDSVRRIWSIDIGNSFAKIARFATDDDQIVRLGDVAAVPTDRVAAFQPSERGDGIAIASVAAPEIARTFGQALTDRGHSVRELGPGDFGLTLEVEQPDRVGADRVAAVAAALRDANRPVLVIDSGTAITLDLGVPGAFCGGLILPGPQMMLRALHRQTARLPELEWTGNASAIYGRSSGEAMRAGVGGLISLGLPAVVATVRTAFAAERGVDPKSVAVHQSGGGTIPPVADDAIVAPDLALRGIAAAGIAALGAAN